MPSKSVVFISRRSKPRTSAPRGFVLGITSMLREFLIATDCIKKREGVSYAPTPERKCVPWLPRDRAQETLTTDVKGRTNFLSFSCCTNSVRCSYVLVRVFIYQGRSEERRVGKEGRSRWSPYH